MQMLSCGCGRMSSVGQEGAFLWSLPSKVHGRVQRCARRGGMLCCGSVPARGACVLEGLWGGSLTVGVFRGGH